MNTLKQKKDQYNEIGLDYSVSKENLSKVISVTPKEVSSKLYS